MMKYNGQYWVMLMVGIAFSALAEIFNSSYVASYMVHNYFHGGEWLLPIYFCAGVGFIALLIQGVIYAAALCTWITKIVKKMKVGQNSNLNDEKGNNQQKQDEYECTDCGASITIDTVRCPSCGANVEDIEDENGPNDKYCSLRETLGINIILRNKYFRSNVSLALIPIIFVSITFFLPIFIYSFILPVIVILLIGYIVWVGKNMSAKKRENRRC